MKTSITLSDKILEGIEDFRRKKNIIPSRSEAIEELILLGLKESSIPKVKGIQESSIPKASIPKIKRIREVKNILPKDTLVPIGTPSQGLGFQNI